jgi:high-affinity Fe2+/Pb2+ permease
MGDARMKAVTEKKKKPLPPWLVGLILAAVIAVVVLWAFTLLGFGDNPVLESAVTGPRSLL